MQSVAPYSATHIGGALGAAVGQSAVVRGRLDRLTEQASDGRTSETFAGLGGGAATSLALTPAVATNANWQGAIEMATGRMGVAQTALSRISDIASRFYALTDTLNGLNASNVSSLAGAARDALTEVAGLMNTTDGGVYVFSGQDSASAPIPDADQMASSGFAVAIANAVAGLASNGANATAAATLNIAASNTAGVSPFSAALSQDAATVNTLRPSATVGRAGSVPTGIMASANGDIASTGGSTTGSYMRDILRGLATLAALSPEQIPAAGFGDLVSDTRASLGDAVTAINQDAGVMGDRQTALAAAKTTLAQASTALQAQVSAVQDIDMAATLSELTRVQTQLQSSYQIIGMLQGLSLTKYLSG